MAPSSSPLPQCLEKGGTIRAINAKGLADKLTRKNIDKLGEVAKTYGAKGLAYSRLTADGTSSSFEKFLRGGKGRPVRGAGCRDRRRAADGQRRRLGQGLHRAGPGPFGHRPQARPDRPRQVQLPVGGGLPAVRVQRAGGPLDGHASSVHLPKAEDLDKVESDPGACHAVAYDIVLNGVEMGGGSMRINDPALQDRMFKALGFTEEKARESFGFLMDAYKFGAPPHGGMAYGLDRMVMLMLKKDSIRDVIAFPKVQNAGEPMSGAPDIVDPQQLNRSVHCIDVDRVNINTRIGT